MRRLSSIAVRCRRPRDPDRPVDTRVPVALAWNGARAKPMDGGAIAPERAVTGAVARLPNVRTRVLAS
jgi:hypothetical protein